MKKYIIVTGGAGFVGSNLIETLLNKTNFKIISIDNYSSGYIKNHIKSSRVKYIKGETADINKILFVYRKKINSLFHFGEFARIYQSFKKFDSCFKSNSIGSNAVFKFCLDNNIKLIYSATSASLGNKGNDKNLSPYAFTKSKNLELLENLKKWFNLKFEIIYFYNVYGPRHIKSGEMATVIGIFENLFKKKKPLTIVRPGNQTRRFTHISDTVDVCIEAWKKNKCKKYISTNKENFSIKAVANLFGTRVKTLPERKGERYKSTIIKSKNTVVRFGKISLKDYVADFKLKNRI